MTRASFAWAGVAAGLGACALAGWALPREAIDWEPARAFTQPWRAFTAVGVHYSVQHLVANLGGVLLAGALGIVAQAPVRLAWAWFAAWPLTQFGLLLEPELAHYGGLSGVLHAGVAIIVAFLLITGTRAQRVVAALVGIGLLAKLIVEAPWGAALRHPDGWDMAVAPFAHASGAIAGALCATIAMHWPTRITPPLHDA